MREVRLAERLVVDAASLPIVKDESDPVIRQHVTKLAQSEGRRVRSKMDALMRYADLVGWHSRLRHCAKHSTQQL